MEDFLERPDPEELLSQMKNSDDTHMGKLKIFLGYAAGVGKTYAMLDEAREQQKMGVDVLVGYIEPHTRPETMNLLKGLPALQPKKIIYKNITLKEFDLETALEKKPKIILVDELAHTNAQGSQNKKRYQDIEELLHHGIDVYTTVNIQHIESLNDLVEDLTKVKVKETVPNYIFDNADKIKLVDVEPEELINRLKEGKIYKKERAESAMANFFTVDKLRLLRELSLRKATERISYVNSKSNNSKENKLSAKLMVCISAAPSSAKCIRWTARMAETLRTNWTVLYVETPSSSYFSEKQKASLNNNMELASRLGGQLITLSGENVADVVCEYANLSGITNIVIGKDKSSNKFRRLFKEDIEDVLVAALPNVEIHIISDHSSGITMPKRKRFSLRSWLQLSWGDTIKTFGLIGLASVLAHLLRLIDMDEQNIIIMYILTVLIISRVTNGFIYGIVGAVVSVIAFNFFFVEPLYTFNATQPTYPITFAIMLIVALITSTLMNRIKSQAKQSVIREKRTEILYDINKKLLATRGLNNIVSLVNDYLIRIFKRSVIFYYDDPQKEDSYEVAVLANELKADHLTSKNEQGVASWVFNNKKRAGYGTDTLSGAMAFYMPILTTNKIVGVLGINCEEGNKLEHDDRHFLRRIASLVAMALERQYLSDEQRKIMVESEKEVMRSNLLSAISHDLRSPLTSIYGASSVLLEEMGLNSETARKLLTDIQTDAGWLIRMVENLLSVTKISNGGVKLAKSIQVLEEVVGESIERVKSRYPEWDIEVYVPDDIVLVPMDGTLIEQVVINLVENAVKYSGGTKIQVFASKDGENAKITVRDDGKGIREGELEHLFDGYLVNENQTVDVKRGLGIGLSICKTIVTSHGGNISASNNMEGGAAFYFTLPLKEEENEK